MSTLPVHHAAGETAHHASGFAFHHETRSCPAAAMAVVCSSPRKPSGHAVPIDVFRPS